MLLNRCCTKQDSYILPKSKQSFYVWWMSNRLISFPSNVLGFIKIRVNTKDGTQTWVRSKQCTAELAEHPTTCSSAGSIVGWGWYSVKKQFKSNNTGYPFNVSECSLHMSLSMHLNFVAVFIKTWITDFKGNCKNLCWLWFCKYLHLHRCKVFTGTQTQKQDSVAEQLKAINRSLG